MTFTETFSHKVGRTELLIECDVDFWEEPSEAWGAVQHDRYMEVDIKSISTTGTNRNKSNIHIKAEVLEEIQEAAEDHFREAC